MVTHQHRRAVNTNRHAVVGPGLWLLPLALAHDVRHDHDSSKLPHDHAAKLATVVFAGLEAIDYTRATEPELCGHADLRTSSDLIHTFLPLIPIVIISSITNIESCAFGLSSLEERVGCVRTYLLSIVWTTDRTCPLFHCPVTASNTKYSSTSPTHARVYILFIPAHNGLQLLCIRLFCDMQRPLRRPRRLQYDTKSEFIVLISLEYNIAARSVHYRAPAPRRAFHVVVVTVHIIQQHEKAV